MASGWILKAAKPTNDPSDYPYRARIGAVRLLSTPVSIKLLRSTFPGWGWPRFTRNITTVPARVARRLWALIHRAGDTTPAPTPQRTADSLARSKAGGGFGNPKLNKLVEKAAIRFVKRHLGRQGYSIRSREKERIGYDLDATKGKEVLHVEVKGVSGDWMTFVITQNEVASARIDPMFRLMVINRARTRQSVVTEFKGSDFDAQFSLNPISYFATKR
jgi:hypothetical protein